MELSPCLNKTALPLRERARDHLNGINAEDGYLVLIVGMKMSGVMRRTCLRKHPDGDPEEPTELRHRPILPSKTPAYYPHDDWRSATRACASAATPREVPG